MICLGFYLLLLLMLLQKNNKGENALSYKINIHCHTIFSDGINTPIEMAREAKELGFSALVITDHFYGKTMPEFISKNSMRLLKKACDEAKEILPIIIGLEVPFMGQEVLVFGGAAIRWVIENDKPTMSELLALKKDTGCAVILCHPGQDFEKAVDAVDGYEHYNSGVDFFKCGRSLSTLEGKQGWCNSDAHRKQDLCRGYNIVDSKIETEQDLIKYIKRGKQPEFVVKGQIVQKNLDKPAVS